MTEMTTADFKKIFDKLVLAFPNYELKSGTFDVYYEVLSNYPREYIAMATMEIINENKFFPAIAEISERIKKLVPSLNPPDWPDAWAEVIEQIHQTGSYGTPAFSDPVITQTVKSLGWRAICLSEEPEGVLRAHFRDSYKIYAERATFERNLLPSTRAMLKAQEAKRWDTFMTLASGNGKAERG